MAQTCLHGEDSSIQQLHHKGFFGYLDGTILCPTSPPDPKTPIPKTTWDLESPTLKKWRLHDAWTLGLLIFNTKNPAGLGINIDGTATEAWTSYIDIYKKACSMAQLDAEQILCNNNYMEHIDFTQFIVNMCTKWPDARALGSKINDEDFKNIIILSLPESWSVAMAPLYNPKMTSADVIARLQIWHTKSYKNKLTNNNGHNIMALQTSTPKYRQRSQLICTNPNCQRRRHTIEMCYWEGRGKEGQFPPGFRKRGSLKGSTSSTRQGSLKPILTAHIMITNYKVDQVFTCITMEDTEFKVFTAINLDKPQIPNNNVLPSSSNQLQQKSNVIDKGELRVSLGKSPLVCCTDPTNKSSIPTLLDSGASNHCFVDMSLFTSYTLFDQPTPGLTAEKGLTFNIAGKGNVKLQTDVNGKKRTITFNDVLYTSGFQYNLISLARIVRICQQSASRSHSMSE